MTKPTDRFTEWTTALDAAAAIHRSMIGAKVRYIGLDGHADGPVGRIIRIERTGLRVRWENATQPEIVHPDDVAWIEP